MSAQMSSGAGGDGKKPEKEKSSKCGNRHQGPCLPACRTCGKVHTGSCRYADPVPPFVAGQAPSQSEMAARYQAQQTGQLLGYQQAYNEMRSLGMGPMRPVMGPVMGPMMGPVMGPTIGGQFMAPMGGFSSPYAVPHGGFGSYGGFNSPGWGAQAWGNRMPGQFGQVQGAFNALPMGQVVAASDDGKKRARGPRGGQKQSGRSKDKKEEKGPLAATSAGIVKPISRSAKNRARRKARKQAQDPSTGPTDPELLANMAEHQVTEGEVMMADDAPPLANEEQDPAFFEADDLIE